jgi:hypothetical protein
MRKGWRAVVIAVGLSVAPGAPGAAPPAAAEPTTSRSDGSMLPGQSLDSPPPPGSPEDQALWRAGLEVTNEVQIERSRATRLQLVLANLRYVDRLRALQARGGEPGERAKEVEKRVNDAHAAQFGVLTARWPVDIFRVCGYPAMEFGSSLSSGRTDPVELARERTLLTGCIEQTRAALKLMKGANDALEAAMNGAEALVSKAEAKSPASSASAAQPSEKPGTR